MAIFFKRVHDLRVDNDFKQREIAERLNVNVNTYPHWESGMYEIPIDIIDKLSKIYDCSVDYLTGLSGVKGSYGREYNTEDLFIRLKRVRKENHLSQSKIGDLLEFGQMNYSRYERGLVLIPFSKLYLLAKRFNVSLDYLMGKTDDKNIKVLVH